MRRVRRAVCTWENARMTTHDHFPPTVERSHARGELGLILGSLDCTSTTMVSGDLFGMHEWDRERLALDDEKVTHVAAEYRCETCGHTLLRRKSK